MQSRKSKDWLIIQIRAALYLALLFFGPSATMYSMPAHWLTEEENNKCIGRPSLHHTTTWFWCATPSFSVAPSGQFSGAPLTNLLFLLLQVKMSAVRKKKSHIHMCTPTYSPQICFVPLKHCLLMICPLYAKLWHLGLNWGYFLSPQCLMSKNNNLTFQFITG